MFHDDDISCYLVNEILIVLDKQHGGLEIQYHFLYLLTG